MPKNIGEEPVARKKMVVVRVRPHCSPDTSGPQYEQYCQQKLMLHRPFREYQQLKLDTTLTLRLLLATFIQAASLHLWRMIYIGYSNSNNRIQVSLIVIVRNLVTSRASTTKPGKSGCCSAPTCSSQLRSRRQHSSPQTGQLRHSFILTYKRHHVLSRMLRRMLSYKYPLRLLILNACKVSSDWCTMQFIVTCRQNILTLCG